MSWFCFMIFTMRKKTFTLFTFKYEFTIKSIIVHTADVQELPFDLSTISLEK